MNFRKSVMAFTLGALSLGCVQGALADSRVQRVDQDTLLVSDFSGKPPFRRQYIQQAEHPELYALHSQRVGLNAQPLMAVESRGVPGKSMPGSRLRISSDPVEIAEFARFEEDTGESVNKARRWSGAPGKGRAAR